MRLAEVATADAVEGLVEQAQAAEKEARFDVAREHYEQALELARRDGDDATVASLHRWIGRTHYREGEWRLAEGQMEAALALAESRGDRMGIAHALNSLAVVHQHRGSLDEAVRLYQEARATAHEAEDRSLEAVLDMNLGIVATIRGELDVALEWYEASIEGLRALGMDEYLSYALNNCGMLYTDLRRWAEAEAAFDEARRCGERTGILYAAIAPELNRVELWIAQGDYRQARLACDAVATLLGDTDSRTVGEMHKHYGVIFRETGELDTAARHLGLAAEIAAKWEDPLLAAETYREQADLFWRQERWADTLRSLNEAHRHFWMLRARREIADIDLRTANLETHFLEIVQRWGESIESADSYTQGHCVRVADYACALARSVGIDERTLFWFRLGALLHDVGKIVVPPEILNKPGKLEPEERAWIEKHPDAGVELLRDIEFPWDVRPMVRFHHERWSGGGYPTGVAGEEIPLSARILCIADVFDALTSDRPYRRGFSQEKALDIMTREMAGHFDPDLLPLWLSMCERGVVALETTPPAPAPPPEIPPAPEPDPEEEEALARSVARLLLIAGGAASAALAGALVASSGGRFELATSPDVASAAQLLGAVGFDAILLDVSAEPLDAVRALVTLQEHSPQIPVLVVADSLGERQVVRAVRTGAQDCLVVGETTPVALARAVRCAIERSRLQTEWRTRSLADDLTGLHNRRGFFTLAPRQIRLARRRKRELAVVFLDVNGFKQINDRHGHREGDRALIDLATVLRTTVRDADLVARMGGDEFVVLLPDVSEIGARILLARLHEEIARQNARPGRRYELSVSVGMTVYDPQTRTTLDELLRRADASMYEQKSGARDLRAS